MPLRWTVRTAIRDFEVGNEFFGVFSPEYFDVLGYKKRNKLRRFDQNFIEKKLSPPS